MLNKKHIILFLIMVLGLVVISSVSATDFGGDAAANASFEEAEIDDVLGQENGDDSDSLEAVDSSSDNVSSESNRDDAPLSASSNKGTFTELQNKINNAPKGSTIYLTKDYYYNKDFGGENGIKITKPITIDGKGHKIDGKNKSALLLIFKTKNVVLKNIIFKNGFINDLGSVGIFYSNNVKFTKCCFDDNTANYGGAVFLAYSNYSSFVGCSFDENLAWDGGGAVFLAYSNYSSFVGCSFDENFAAGYGGGAVYLDCSSSNFESCSFSYNAAFEDMGGAVCLNSSSSSFESCVFNENRAGYGGAVCLDSSSSSFESCDFVSGFCMVGGAIYSIQSSLNIADTNFDSDYANDGGDIYSQYSMIFLSDSSFNNSQAVGFGGSLSFSNDYVHLDNCVFENSTSDQDGGGAIYCSNSIVNIFSSQFSDCIAYYGGAICSLNTELNVQNNSFYNNRGFYLGGSIYAIYGSITVNWSVFEFSSAIRGGSIYIRSPNKINNISYNYFLYSFAEYGQRIYLDGYYGEIPVSGNIFEDIYFVVVKTTIDARLNGTYYYNHSNVLTYVVSNLDVYFGDISFYNNLRNRFILNYLDSPSLYSNDVYSITIHDVDNPDNSTIFLKNGNMVNISYNSIIYSNELTEVWLIGYCNFVTSELSRLGASEYSFSHLRVDKNSNFSFIPKDYLGTDYGNPYGFKMGFCSVPLINSSFFTDYLPSSYDSRDYGYITPVKDQHDGSNCWAFSGIATLEACLKKVTGETYDFSENNAKNIMATSSIYGLNIDPNAGGYDTMFMSYLASWLGPVSEKNDQYNWLSSLSIIRSPSFHIQDICFLPARQTSSDNDEFKSAIMNYGAVSVILNWTVKNDYRGLHSVSLVGWDDNYNNFDSLGNYAKGAWIFKNSWGADWGNNGFGYLSYEQNLSGEIAPYMHAYTFMFNDSEFGYQEIYQYDFAGVSDYLCSDTDFIYYKNKFTTNKNMSAEYLYAFSTYFEKPTYFTFSVRINDENVTKTEEGVEIVNSVHYSPAGYHTIPLGYNLTLNPGDEFEIIIKLLNLDGNGNYIPVCQADELYKLSYPSGVSFVSHNGKDWIDLYDLDSNNRFAYGGNRSDTCQVACIKAFTTSFKEKGWDFRIEELYDKWPDQRYSFVRLKISPFNNVSINEKISIYFDLVRFSDLFDSENFVEVCINDKVYYAKIPGQGDAKLEISFDKEGYYSLSARIKSNWYGSNVVSFDFIVVNDKDFCTFTDLNEIIINAENESLITLDKNYYFDNNFKNNTILINKSLTIDGNGHSLNAFSKSSIFTILSGCNVTLKNITFKNGNDGLGHGAVVSEGNLSVSSCKFTNNNANSAGGAICSYGECHITNSIFRYNSASCGGAIYSENTLNVANSIFTDNRAADYGGSIFSIKSCLDVTDSTFKSSEDNEEIYFSYNDTYVSHGSLNLKNNKMLLKNAAVFYDEDVPYNAPLHLVFVNGSEVKGDHAILCQILDDEGNTFRLSDVNVTLTDENNSSINLNAKYDSAFGGYVFDTSFMGYGFYQVDGTLSGSYSGNYTVTPGTLQVVKKNKPSIWRIYVQINVIMIILKDYDDGNAFANTYVFVKLNKETIKIKTNSEGQAYIPVKLAPKKYTITISTSENEKYSSFSITEKILVKKTTPKITAYKKKTFKLKTKTKKYTITLKNNLGKAMKNTKVTIKVNGKTYTAKTNSKGKATFKITKLNKKGSFTATVKYGGNKYYKSVTKKVKITVKK